MKLHPRVTRPMLELVKRFEGLRRRAAALPDGRYTIGYGHVRTARPGLEIGPEDAEALLRWDLSDVAARLEAWCFAPLNQNQFEALAAFAFNIGLENFRRSEVLRLLNAGDALGAAEALEAWRFAELSQNLQRVDALVRRRAAEKAHFLTPPEGFPASPSQVVSPRPGRLKDNGPSAELLEFPVAGAAVPPPAPPLEPFPVPEEAPPPPREAAPPARTPEAVPEDRPARPAVRSAPAEPHSGFEDPFLEGGDPGAPLRRRPNALLLAPVAAGALLFLAGLAATLLGLAPAVSLAAGLAGILIAAAGGVYLLTRAPPKS